MPKHRNDAYQDDAHKWVVFCKVCGLEEGQEGYNPEGECSGEFVARLISGQLASQPDQINPVGNSKSDKDT